jgi:dTDP-4-amino-4,6-dideoxy-D-galactose acyltransferase
VSPERRTPRVEHLDWDSEYWNVRAARLYLESEHELAEGLGMCREADVEWVSLLVPSEQRSLVVAAVRAGFELVDTRFEMSCVLDRDENNTGDVAARPEDATDLVSIARSAFADSRFFNDTHLDDRKCAEFYATWMRNSLNGQLADVVIVDRQDSELTGFITVRLDQDRAELPLVAVAPRYHGRGVGHRLLESALEWIGRTAAVEVGVVTQLTNLPAIRLYSGAGFRMCGSGVWLHRWWG